MSLANSIADDYKVVDDTETVTYLAVRESGNTTYTVQFADPHEYTQQEVAMSQGLFTSGQRRWGLGRNQLPAGFRPQAGDRITQADGTFWTLVHDAVLDDLNVSWFCQTNRGR